MHKAITLPLDAVNNIKRVGDARIHFNAVVGPIQRVTFGVVFPLIFLK